MTTIPSPRFVSLSGKLLPADAPALHPANRAFRQGYALVETMLLRDGRLPLAALHWARLAHGMAVLGISAPAHFQVSDMEEAALGLARRNGDQRLARVRIELWPGNGGINDPFPARPDWLIETWALEESQVAFNENGLVAGIAEGLAKAPDQTSGLKTANALIYALAARQARAQRWNDALVCNAAGRVIESSIANIFWVKDGIAFTPPLSEGCVAGIGRRVLLEEILPKACIPAREAPLTSEALAGADEVFLTNALRGPRWIGQVEDYRYRHGLASRIAHEWQQHVAAR